MRMGASDKFKRENEPAKGGEYYRKTRGIRIKKTIFQKAGTVEGGLARAHP